MFGLPRLRLVSGHRPAGIVVDEDRADQLVLDMLLEQLMHDDVGCLPAVGKPSASRPSGGTASGVVHRHADMLRNNSA